jgi:hypothetical protein
MQGFGAAAKQQELFGTKGKKKGEPTPGALRTGAVEEEVTEEAIPVAEGRIVREEDLKAMGIGPSNKKIREQILGKNLDDPAQAQTVKEVLDEFGSDPNRSPRVAKGVEDFLTGLGFRKAKDEPTGQPVVGATEPGVSVSDKRRSRATKGVKTPDTGSMANAGETPKPADVGAATAQPALDADALTNEEQSALQDELQTELFGEGEPSVKNLPVASDKKVTRKRPIPQNEIDEANTYLKQYVEKAGSVEGALKQIAAEFAFEKKVNRMAKMSYNALSDKHKELVDREIQQQRTLNTAGAMYLSRYNEALRAKRESKDEEKRLEEEALNKQNEQIRKQRAQERKKDEEVKERVGQQIQDLLSGRKIRYRRAEKGAKSTKAAVEKFVAGFTKNWKNAPPIVVVQSVEGLPPNMQAQLLKDRAGDVPGAFNPNDETVYLIADNIKNPHQVALTIVHESIGHYGLQAILGAQYRKVMHRLYNTNHQVRAKANMKMAEGMDLSTAVEEVLAEAVESRYV